MITKKAYENIHLMKKNILIFALLLSIVTSYAQRKKTPKNSKAVASSKTILATAGYMTAELQKNTFFITIDNQKSVKDTMQLKIYQDKLIPSNCKLQAFTTKGRVLHCISWVDTYQKNSPLIKETITETNSVIFDATTKTKLHSNSQKSTAISEIHFLDVKKTVSETIDRKRNEGYVFTLLPNGDFNLKSKNQNETLSYDTNAKSYLASRKK